jgi:hypothetical protein
MTSAAFDCSHSARYGSAVRVQAYAEGISVRAIVGTHVVLFGFDAPKERVRDLMGFALRRTDVGTGRSVELDNFLLFKANDNGHESDHSSFQNPFQEFVWGDYTLQPDRAYRYEVVADVRQAARARAKSERARLKCARSRRAPACTALFFNRGVAGSQAYSRRFTQPGQTKPPAPSDGRREGLRMAVARASGGAGGFHRAEARGKHYGLRAAVYEFHVWSGTAGVREGCRVGGLYGQWNVGHIVREQTVAQRYLNFWSELVGDPAPAAARAWDGTATPVPSELPNVGVTSIFSPRRGLQALKWYARRMEKSDGSVFLTAAFGVNKELTAIFEQP